jgi:hypothetical protein
MSALARSVEGLPGAELVLRGLPDLADAQPTPEAALIEVARTRLASLGLPLSPGTSGVDAELRLYDRLAARHPDRDPYVLSCAWLDQLVSFLAALRSRQEGGVTAG